MIRWILSRMGENPNIFFYRKELEERFPGLVLQAIQDRLLVRSPSNFGRYDHGLNKSYLVVEDEEGFAAIDEEDSETDPISLGNDDLARYKFDLDAFARTFQQSNNLTGKPSKLTDRLFFLGEIDIESELTACILAFMNAAPVTQQILLSLPSLLPSHYKKILAICPNNFPELIDQRHLEALHIRVLPLGRENPFVLPSLKNQFEDLSKDTKEFLPGEEYQTLRWKGRSYSLSLQQAEVVRMLHHAQKMGTSGLKWNQIQRRLNSMSMSPARMRDVFKESPLWHTLVINIGHGMYSIDI